MKALAKQFSYAPRGLKYKDRLKKEAEEDAALKRHTMPSFIPYGALYEYPELYDDLEFKDKDRVTMPTHMLIPKIGYVERYKDTNMAPPQFPEGRRTAAEKAIHAATIKGS